MRQWMRRLRTDHWKWGKLVHSTLRAPGAFTSVGVHPVDAEVIPSFSGEPEDMEAWLIFATREEAEAATDRAGELREATCRLLVRAGFPVEALPSFRLLYTSLPEIESGGGRFMFFR